MTTQTAKHLPNAETLAAMEEIEHGRDEAITLEEFRIQLDALG